MDMEEPYCSKSDATASAIVSPKSSSTSPKSSGPKKGILKTSNRSSSTKQEPNLNRYSIATSNATDIQHMEISPTHRDRSDSMTKKMHWDEMNILATYHPTDKDYGFMKVNEPPTPYNKCESVSDDERDVPVDANKLESELNLIKKLPKYMQEKTSISDNDDDDDQDAQKRNPQFEARRKAHYDEFKMAQILKSSINDDDDDNEAADDGNSLAKKVDTALKTNHT